jgi:hypothetical protein
LYHSTDHLLKGKQALPLIDHDFLDRQAALRASITIYRKLKDNGFHDQLRKRARFKGRGNV